MIKRDDRREPYDRGKLIKSLSIACSKRPISVDEIEAMANDVENSLTSTQTTEIKSMEIGEMIMERLRSIDKVAYVRYASVYRDFKDLGEFVEEINKLK